MARTSLRLGSTKLPKLLLSLGNGSADLGLWRLNDVIASPPPPWHFQPRHPRDFDDPFSHGLSISNIPKGSEHRRGPVDY